jgi:reactive intermediate/imine deaminase
LTVHKLEEIFMPVEMLGASPVASDRLARPLSPATRAGDFVFVSGQVPTNDQGEVVSGGIEAQTRQVFARIEQALALAGCTLSDVCKVSVWLDDARDFGSFNRVYMECFGSHRPARSTVEARLMIDAKVEIDVTAYKPR